MLSGFVGIVILSFHFCAVLNLARCVGAHVLKKHEQAAAQWGLSVGKSPNAPNAPNAITQTLVLDVVSVV